MNRLHQKVRTLLRIASLLLSLKCAVAQEVTCNLKVDNRVSPGPGRDSLTDARVFNAEFYRKLYPQLHLASDAAATHDWLADGARGCRRGSFLFYSRDYLNRYHDLAGDCVAAVEHFVVAGSNEGRIGAADSDPLVFDFNYYVDPRDNPDLARAYNHPWDLVDLQLHWLQHGIRERRGASPFFNVREYQARYPDVPRDPARAIYEYVTSGLARGRLGRAAWADPAKWNALVQEAVRPQRTATPNDEVRTFKSARGAPVTVVVKSPGWYDPALPSPWSRLKADQICTVPPPGASGDLEVIQGFLDRMATGSQKPCRVVRLAANAAYHIVLPAKLPVSQDWVLNHRPHLTIHDAQDFVFDGNGATLYFTGSTGALDVDSSARGIVENLVVDWGNPLDPNPTWRGPLFEVMGTIRKDSATSGHIELDPGTKLPPGFSPYIYTFHLWDRVSGQMAREDDLPGPTDEACDAGCIAQQKKPTQAMHLQGLALFPNNNPSGKWVSGNLAQFANRYVLVALSQFPVAAVSLHGSGDLRLVRCALHASPYMGIVGGDRQRGISIEDLTITPSQGRHISTTADGVHLTGALGDVVIDHATFEALGDDAINMAEVWDTVTKVATARTFTMAGADSPAGRADTLAFFDETLAFVGSAGVQSSTGDGTQAVQLQGTQGFLRPGLKAINMSHIPSGFYMSGVTVRRKIGHGIIFGGLHGVIQNSRFENLTSGGIGFHFSSYWSEGAPSSDIAIRNNEFVRVAESSKFYQAGTGMGTYPHRNAAITVFAEAVTDYDQVPDNFVGIYPAFQDIEISGNHVQSLSGADLYMAGVYNPPGSSPPGPGGTEGVLSNRFMGCGKVAQTDRMRPYFGSESDAAVVLTFVDGVALIGNRTTAHPACGTRMDYSTSRNVKVADD